MATKAALIEKVTKKLGYLSKVDAQIAVDSVIDCIKNELCKKHRIEIRGFGSFSIREKRFPDQEKKFNTVYFRMSKNVQDALK